MVARQVRLDRLVRLDLKDPRVESDQKASKVYPVHQDHWDQQESWAQWDRRDHRVTQGRWDLMAHREHQVSLAYLESLKPITPTSSADREKSIRKC